MLAIPKRVQSTNFHSTARPRRKEKSFTTREAGRLLMGSHTRSNRRTPPQLIIPLRTKAAHVVHLLLSKSMQQMGGPTSASSLQTQCKTVCPLKLSKSREGYLSTNLAITRNSRECNRSPQALNQLLREAQPTMERVKMAPMRIAIIIDTHLDSVFLTRSKESAI